MGIASERRKYVRNGSTTAFASERGAAVGTSGSGAASVTTVAATNAPATTRKTSGHGSHSDADTAKAPASSMPIR
jgi:hypothetical protein